MSIFHTHHIDIFALLKRRDGIKPLVYSTILRTSAIALIGLFSGIYVYENAIKNSFSHKNALLAVVAFYALFALMKFLFLILGEKYSAKFGFKHTIRLSLVPFVITIPLMIIAEYYFAAIFLGGLFWGAHAGLFWWGYHGYFVKAQNSKSYGSAMGSTDFFYAVTAIITPIAGALLITYIGFSYVYAISLLLMILSMLILGRDNDAIPKHKTSLAEVIKDAIKSPLEYLTLASRGVSFETHGIFWHLYVYFLFDTVLDLGFISSISVLVVSFLSIFIGKYNDKHGEKKSIYFGSPVLSMAWVIRYLANTYPFIILANTAASLGGRTLHISIDEILYKQASRGHTSETLLFRELGLITGMFIVLITSSLFIILNIDIKNLFILAAAVSLIPTIFANKQ